MFFMCLSLLCGRGRGCAARRGRRPLELLGHANTRSSFLLHLCLPILLMQELWSSSFKNAPALNALPVHLLRQVYFLMILDSFLMLVVCSFFGRSWMGFWGPSGRFWSHLGGILESFWWLFQGKVDLWKRVFYCSKTMFSEVWEGPGSCLFRVVFLDRYFWSTFCSILEICWASGSPWWSKWVSLGELEGPN